MHTHTILRGIAKDPALLEIGRRAIEDSLVDHRDSRIAVLIGPEQGLAIGLKAIADHLEKDRAEWIKAAQSAEP